MTRAAEGGCATSLLPLDGDPPGMPWTYENEPNACMEIVELE